MTDIKREMKKYAVTFKEVITKTIEIEAEDFDQACVLANEIDNPDMEKNMDDWSLEIDSIREVID